ncbi:MAG: HAD family hydrolase [Methylacidiphilales bacterium]|nr:HAD family hydrolase [Candidatus Methylacidiphilales bacterium]
MNPHQTLLLLDLDGVVVFEAEPPHFESAEILLLHDLLADVLRQTHAPVVVVTHRSKAEARRILEAARLDSSVLSGIVAAEDLLRAGLKHHGILRVARKGLRKSLILPVVEQRFGIARARMALIDDRLDNLEDMLAHGIGLALLAPSLMENGGSLVSFDVNEAVEAFKNWDGSERRETVVRLTARTVALDPWRKTGLNTRRQGRHFFNLMRRMGRATRTRLFEKRS